MSSTNVNNVSASKPSVTGALSVAPLGTTLPIDATTALSEDFKSLGYIGEDGLTNSPEMDSEDLKAWGGDIVDSTVTKSDKFVCKLIEIMNPEVLKTVYGSANVTGTSVSDGTGLKVIVNNDDPTPFVWVIDMILKGNILKRIVIPNGKITGMEDIVYNDSELAGYEITITAFATDNVTHHEYLQKKTSE